MPMYKMYSEKQLVEMLEGFRSMPSETEWLEFKEAKKNFDMNTLGEYFSALSNEANIKKHPCAWLIFGVQDKPVPRAITGTNYRDDKKSLDSVKLEIARETGGITFTEIYELKVNGKRVIMFQIPPALQGIPTSWKGHFYGRHGESIGALSIGEIEQIRNSRAEDWTAHAINGASIKDLDEAAISKARLEYKRKHENASFYKEIDKWDDLTFLNKVKLAVHGKLTRAAIILLGKAEAVPYIAPAVAKLTWILKDASGIELDYTHFEPPFVLSVDLLLAKIRNLTLREMPDGTLFPVEISQYDPWVMREALHNCIAHQDYRLNTRITVIETPVSLLFVNAGKFIPGSVENVLEYNAPSDFYPNRCLSDAMVALNMIDTIGSGIRKMFMEQKRRFMPLPDYDLKEMQKVKVTLPGQIIDKAYTRLLMKKPDLLIRDVILLDKIQKKYLIPKDAYSALKKKGLAEGRYPNIFISAEIAGSTGEMTTYIRNRGFDDKYYMDMIIEYLRQNGSATRAEIDKLLLDKLPDILSITQKKNKINYLLSHKMRGQIKNNGTCAKPRWTLSFPILEF